MTWFHVVPSVSLPDRTFIISRYPTTVLLLLLFFFFFIKTLHKFYIRKPKFDQTNSHQMSSCDGAKESLTWLKQRLTHRFICNASGCLRWHFDNGLWSDTSMCGFSCYKYPGGGGAGLINGHSFLFLSSFILGDSAVQLTLPESETFLYFDCRRRAHLQSVASKDWLYSYFGFSFSLVNHNPNRGTTSTRGVKRSRKWEQKKKNNIKEITLRSHYT